MNIALATTEFVSETNFDGGLANYTYKLAAWLINNNHKVTVFLTSDKNEKTNYNGIPIIKVVIPDLKWKYKYNLERFKLGFLLNKKKYHGLEFFANSKYINKAIEEENRLQNFDIVQYPHISGLALCCPKNLASIVRISSSTRLCQQFGGYGDDNLVSEAQEEIEIKGMKRAAAVFGPSKMIAALTEPILKKEIKVIETPYIKPIVELDDSLLKQYLIDEQFVLFFGSIGLIKGVGTIAEIIFDLLEKKPSLHFVFIGKKIDNKINRNTIWDHLIEKAKQHKSRVIHIHPLKHDQLFPFIKKAACVVLPSRIDNFPNTCIEAMANKKIVIGTKGNGFEQLIENGKNGFLIDVDDHKDLLAKITHILNLPSVEREKIELAAASRTDKLDPDIVLNELITLYKNTIQNFKT
jgi:glycosyltransferase involved in cell wall biosynthesis